MDREIKTKIAFWYYSAGLTQEEIARRLKLTRQKVNAVIGSLKEDGIVTVSIRGCEQDYVEWEHCLEERFGLTRAIIVPDYGDPHLGFLKVANAAAQYLERTLEPGDVIGVSWGRTLAATIREMRFERKADCRVVQLVGAQSLDGFSAKSDDIVRALSDKLDAPTYMLYAPVTVSKAQTKQLLLEEKSIRRSYEMMERCNVGIFGIGELSEDSLMYRKEFFSPEDIERLHEDGFCADIGMNPVRADGSMDNCFLQERLLNASPDCIRRMENTIAIAAGEGKAEAVLAVLKSGVLQTLIIDCSMAAAIMEKIKEESV